MTVSDGDGPIQITLTLPTRPEHIRLARLVASGLVAQLDYGLDDVEDLRIAVDELCFHLLGDTDDEVTLDESRTMDLIYSAEADSITITGRTGLSGAVPEASELSEQILDALVDEHEVSGGDGIVTFRLKKARES